MKISDLTIREKVLQTVIMRVEHGKFTNEKIGGIFLGSAIIENADEAGLDNARELVKKYKDNADIPLLVCSDFENGCGGMLKGFTVMPYLMSLGAAHDENLAYDYGKATALEGKSVGANWSLSPVCDLFYGKADFVAGVRAISDNPEVAIKLLNQVIKGMQENGLSACMKHFPGHGDEYRDAHMAPIVNTLDEKEWKETFGKVYKSIIDNGVWSVMTSHCGLSFYQKNDVKDGKYMPATLSHELTTKLLKEEMGFEGVVVTDALDMGGFLCWYECCERAEVECFKAGTDMMLWPTENYADNLVKAVECGYVSMERLDDAVSRILNLKQRNGLFDNNDFIDLTKQDRDFVKNVQKRTAEKSITLVRDKLNVFPLRTDKTKTIVVVPITHHEPALKEAELLVKKLKEKGFEVTYCKDCISKEIIENNDIVLYAVFARVHRPWGVSTFMNNEYLKTAQCNKYGREKTVVVCFGEPFYEHRYFEMVQTYVNAYSFVSASVEAFVKAATGETDFASFLPVNINGEVYKNNK